MTIEICLLVDPNDTSKNEIFDVEMPMVPRIGDVILVEEIHNYEVTEVVHKFDAENRFTITRVTAKSLFNFPDNGDGD